MKYCPEIGKIYDTLFYCLEYYNEKSVKEHLIKKYTDSSFMAVYYNEIEASTSPLPQILAPIFYYQSQKRHSAITNFFDEQIDFEDETIDSFIKKIISKSDLLYTKIMDAIFPSDQADRPVVPLIAPESYIEALTDSDYSESFKLQVSLLFGNYNYAISILTDLLRTIYTKIDELYKKHQDKVNAVISQIESEKNAQIYKEVLGFDPSGSNYGISLLNQYITLTITNSHSIMGILLGLRHEDDINLQFDEKNIDLQQILIAVGNETRYAILQVLMEHEELTSSTLAKILKLPPTTALRHVEFLYDSNVLYISRRSGLQIFYRINYNILSSATRLFANKLGGKTNERANKEDISKVG